MLLVQPRWMPAWLAIDQTSRLARVEPRHPVAHHLQRHAACLRRPGPAGAVVDHRKRHQPTDLIGVFALAGQPAQQRRNARAWRKNLNGPAVTARMLVVDDEPDVEVRFRQLFRPEVREGLYTFDFAPAGAASRARCAGADWPSLYPPAQDFDPLQGFILVGLPDAGPCSRLRQPRVA